MTSHLAPSSLTPRAERAIRRASTAAVSFVAVAAAVLSFSGLHELAVRSGFHPTLGILFPLATDVAVAAFSLAVLHHRMVGLRAWWPWLCMMLGVAVSVAGNIWAAPPDMVSRLVHAWPPIIFALSFETVTRLVRHRITHATPAEGDAEDAATVGHATVTSPEQSTVAPITAPTLPDRHLAASTVSEPAAAAEAAPAVPPANAERAVDQPAPAVADTSPVVEDAIGEESKQEPAPAAVPVVAQETPQPVAPTPAPAAPAPAAPAPAAPAPKAAELAPKNLTAERPKPPQAGTVREQIVDILRAAPDTTAAQIARDLNRDRSYVSKIVREVKKELVNEDPAPAGQAQPQVEDQAPTQPEPADGTTPTVETGTLEGPDAPEPTDIHEDPAATMSERLSTPAPAMINVPHTDPGAFDAVPFPHVEAHLHPVPEAKQTLFQATGENADVSVHIWTRLELPTGNHESVTQAQLDEALSMARSLEVAGAR